MKPIVPDIMDVLLMVADVYPVLAKECSVANPQKDGKFFKNIREMQKYGLATLLLLMYYPIPLHYL